MNRSKSIRILAVALAGGFLLLNSSVSSAATTKSATNSVTTVQTNTNKVDKGKKLAKNTYMTVAYKPNRHIHIYVQKGNHFKRNGKLLKNGYTHRIYNLKKSGKSTYYYIGKNKWVNSANIVTSHLKHTRYHVLKKHTKSRQYYTSQYNPVFAPWGCASAALSMLMKYDHSFNKVPGNGEKDELTYMQNHLPRNKANGGQDGDPYTGAGFTRVIQSYKLKQYAHQLGDKKIVDISGISLNNIKKVVLAGHPVLYYGWSSYNGNGKGAQPWPRNHCKVIFGYSKKSNTFLVHDPLYMNSHFYKGGGGAREGIHNGYDLGPIAWVKASHINREFAHGGGNHALTIR